MTANGATASNDQHHPCTHKEYSVIRSIRRCATALSCAVAIGALLPGATAAQAAPDTIPLDSLFVTATRQPLARDAVPAAVSIIAGDDLRARGERLLVDALRLTPGTAMVQSGPQGALSSLYLRGGESDYVRVLVDGVPV